MCHFDSHKALQVVIFAEKLKLFSLRGDLNDYLIYSPALIEGFINFDPSEDLRGDREFAYRLHRLLWQLSGVKTLSISNDALEVLDCAKDLLAHLPSFGRLDSLYLIQSPTEFTSEALWTILRKSPRLGLLDFYCGFWSGDSEDTPVINPVPSCFSTHLKTIRIHLREEDGELYFLSELLRIGSVLEKVHYSSLELQNIPDAILRLYRQSQNCVISLAAQKSLKSSRFI